ncbi:MULTISPECIES: HDOD domain-containing protein [unclassified Undibacterium]|uniref:HDOD domain-containing protein n=2 Tax=Pseudomonadota TaxID=1224 RepID=UPI002AC8F23E|nr:MULTISPECIES: HDOD domain-containing protein [unclassified Undibacterium]MEB0140786.1 HDOD domain-containing protein [Undibacterium sp. CCC2.1]MEB0173760.1 HDOD domain-containing protein [Undibacterium sp. CCC1.1]MEB0177763.1 HDOD domain-containing protein [Undibacterium sp. CCC3.4]MEB0216963.1 HDOD domain-containing protein [Undibacterium sp. 5I2]WPX44687.1 HDOD domain-containing protein [Undibacterium sp. CCC3.4]
MGYSFTQLFQDFFGSRRTPAPALIPQTPPPPVLERVASEEIIVTAAAPLLQIWRPALPVDTLFFDWIMGYPSTAGSDQNEQKILQALYAFLASDLNDAVVVPRMPSVIPQLLASMRNKSVAIAELSRLIIKDVVLVAEVINAVNSALYNPADRINSLDKAIMLLGEEGLRLVIAKVAFRPIINLSAGPYTRRAAPPIWLQAEKCALACHALSTNDDGFSPFLAFLTGLMKNVGLIVALRVLDNECGETKLRYSSGFQHAFAAVAATLSYRIARRWEFPPEVVQALELQAGGSRAKTWSRLGVLLHTADLLSKMRILVNQGQLSHNDGQLTQGLPVAETQCFLTLNELQLFELQHIDAPR